MRDEALDRAFTALAERTRRGVVDALRAGPRRAGELAAELDVSAPALTRHLRVLRESGLVEEVGDDADARVSIYRLRSEGFQRVQRWVDDVQAMWQEQLTAFARHVQKTRGRSKP